MTIRKIEAGRVITKNIDNFVGQEGTIFYDEQTGELRLSDGTTPGGTAISGGGSGYILPKASNNTLGGVKVGANLSISGDGTISVAAPYVLTTATASVVGGIKVGANLSISGDGTLSANASQVLPTVSEINNAGTVTNQVTNVTTFRFDKDTGFSVQDLGSGTVKVSLGSTFKTWKVDGQQDLIAVGEDTIRLVAGTGVTLATNPNAAIKTLTISAAVGSSVIKTFNILNEFTAPLMGKAIYIPDASTTIRSVQLVNGIGAVGVDLMVGLYRNNELLNFFTLPAGNITEKYTNLDYFVTPSDYISVNVVSGQGGNFNMVLFNA
jgi:hypothetical protein